MTNSIVSNWEQRRDWLWLVAMILLLCAGATNLAGKETMAGWMIAFSGITFCTSLACWYKVGWKKTLYPDDE